jgi:outer membrane protein assembly factor BamA
LQFRGRLDTKPMPDTMKPRFVLSAIGSVYPAIMDVVSSYESLDAWTAGYFTLPLPKKPVLALRAGGKKLWGDFPYFDAAFLGGTEAFRVEYKQRWAGDASLYGTTELRYPIARFPLIVPVDFGALGFVDAGRVYVDGDSPGGWHTATGAGFWFGFLNSRINYNVMITNQSHARILGNFGFAF